MEKKYCPYCGVLLSEGCTCEQDIIYYEKMLVDRYEEESLMTAYQQDIIDMYRYER